MNSLLYFSLGSIFESGVLDSQVSNTQYIDKLISDQNEFIQNLTSEQKEYVEQCFYARGGDWFTQGTGECVKLEHLFDAHSPGVLASDPENPENLWIETQLVDTDREQTLLDPMSDEDDLPPLMDASDSDDGK